MTPAQRAHIERFFKRDKDREKRHRLRHQARRQWDEQDYVPPKDLMVCRPDEYRLHDLRGV